MEHEIAALKAKLSSADDRVKELEASKVRYHRMSPTLSYKSFPLYWKNQMKIKHINIFNVTRSL